MKMLILIGVALVLPSLANAACPPDRPDQRAAQTAPLFEQLATSETEIDGRTAASAIWQIWTKAPDKEAQSLLDKGMQSIQWGAFDEAETALGYLIDYCPDYPEGWNQRAFARYLKEDYSGAIADLDRALELEPKHFGALAGRGLTLLRQGKKDLGLQAIRSATKLHPWMSERHLLPPDRDI